MAKQITEEKFKELKRLILKHPTLSQNELSKLAGVSPRTVCVTNTSTDFIEYKERVRSWNHKKKTASPEIVTEESSHEDDREIFGHATESLKIEEEEMIRDFCKSLVEMAYKFEQLMTMMINNRS